MSKLVQFENSAEEELHEAVSRYESEEVGLGAALLAEVERLVELVREFPAVGAPVPRVPARLGVRRIPLRRFPYVLVYRDRPDEVQIVALAHMSRRPGYWRNR